MSKPEFEFDAVIRRESEGRGGMYVEFPFDAAEAFGTSGRIKVVCRFGEMEYRGSLLRMGTVCHIVGLRKDMAQALGKGEGDVVRVRLREDIEERNVEPHPLLASAIAADGELRAVYGALPFTREKEMNASPEGAKKERTRHCLAISLPSNACSLTPSLSFEEGEESGIGGTLGFRLLFIQRCQHHDTLVVHPVGVTGD